MSNPVHDHEKLFDEICNKLKNLSADESAAMATDESSHVKYFEKMQSNLKNFQSEVSTLHDELRNKIKNIEEISLSSNGINEQIKQLSDQLSEERKNNTRLSSDLAKSLEMNLQLQLEVQAAKARSIQIQNEERKYSLAILEKNKGLHKELELNKALKEDLSIEIAKAKSAQEKSEQTWADKRQEFLDVIEEKNYHIEKLNGEIEQLSVQFAELELAAKEQTESMKNLMTIAENKIVEIKVALDKKGLEVEDLNSQLLKTQQQAAVLHQENLALRDYVAKLNYYHQQQQHHQQQISMRGSN